MTSNGAPGPGPGRGSSPLLLPGLLAVVGLIVAVIGIIMLLGDGDESDSTTVRTVVAVLEPADSLGPEPFTEDFAAEPVVEVPVELEAPLTEPAPLTTEPPAVDPSTGEQATSTTSRFEPRSNVTLAPPGAPGEVVRVSAAAPGLYGGTQDNARCNTTQLVDFLAGNPNKAGAWVDALNADPTVNFRGEDLGSGDVGSYVESLTPVVLLADTLVVNHGFRDGRPTPRDAVLQKGSAVLIDDLGVPRTRCACGNPLTQPQPGPTEVEPQGNPWPGFNPNKVAVVEPLPGPVALVRLVDLSTGVEFDRPMGTKGERDLPTVAPTTTTTAPTTTTTAPTTTTAAPTTTTTTAPTTSESTTTVVLGTGDVQATLEWFTDVDLDLHVIDPGGDEISWEATTSISGGQLDVDDVPAAGDNGRHVENVFWPVGAAPVGSYEVWVEHFSGDSSEYTLTVRRDGVVIYEEPGSVGPGESSARFEFTR